MPPEVTVFGPHPLLGVTIERRGESDDVHMHPAGQGVWVARMAGEMGAHPVLCGFIGGETGKVLQPLLDELPGVRRLVSTAAWSGSYVMDRRSGEREPIAFAWSNAPTRHEIDDLFSLTTTSALAAEVLVLCGPVPSESLPVEIYGKLVADARGGDTRTIVDLSPPRLNSALEGEPDIVKLNDWQLAEFVEGPVSSDSDMRKGAEAVLEAGAGAVMVTRGGDPALIATRDRTWELTPPRFDEGAPEGSGDSMVGAMAAMLAQELSLEDTLRWGAAAGAANFLRHGLGTGSRTVVEDLLPRVELREV
ncbi:MAG: 1-phosphofructokinase family hexose kinase [Solirubrobacterales bacterium]